MPNEPAWGNKIYATEIQRYGLNFAYDSILEMMFLVIENKLR